MPSGPGNWTGRQACRTTQAKTEAPPTAHPVDEDLPVEGGVRPPVVSSVQERKHCTRTRRWGRPSRPNGALRLDSNGGAAEVSDGGARGGRLSRGNGVSRDDRASRDDGVSRDNGASPTEVRPMGSEGELPPVGGGGCHRRRCAGCPPRLEGWRGRTH